MFPLLNFKTYFSYYRSFFSLIPLVFTILFSFVLLSNLIAQDYKFDHLTLEDGLNENGVFSLFLDSKGFLWAGTCNGLIKYDGQKFKSFLRDESGSFDLAAGCIYSIDEDSLGNLWIATYHGLCYLDTGKEKLSYIPHLEEKAVGIANALWYAHIDRIGNLWIIDHQNQLIKYDTHSKQFLRFNSENFPNSIFENYQINILRVGLGINPALIEDSNGNIWLGTKEKGVIKMSTSSEHSFEVFSLDKDDSHKISNNSILDIFEDSKQNIWIGTGGGIILLQANNNKFTTLQNKIPQGNTIPTDSVWITLEDDLGNLWIASKGKVSRLNPQSNQLTHFPLDQRAKKNFGVPMHAAIDGSFWIYDWNSKKNLAVLNELNLNTKKLMPYISQKDNKNGVNSGIGFTQHLVDHSGVLWIGSFREGINKLDPGSKQFYSYYPQKKGILTFQSKQLRRPSINVLIDDNGILWLQEDGELIWVRHHIQDKQGNIWFINNQRPFNTNGKGITRLDLSSKTYTTFFDELDTENSACGNSATYLLLDRIGNVWIGFWDYFTAAPGGLAKYDNQQGKFKCFQFDPKSKTGIAHESLSVLYEDKESNIWIGHNGVRGDIVLQKLNPKTEVFTDYKGFKVTIWDIEEAGDNKIWIGTILQGLILFDLSSGKIVKQYGIEDGIANTSVQDIEIDKNGNLWLRTEFGISKFNPELESFINYTIADGLLANRANGTQLMFKGKKENIFVATPSKTSKSDLIYFTPEKVTANPFAPKIAFTDFKLFNKKVEIGENGPLQKHISKLNKINLDYKQNDFTIEFAALHFSRPQENEYAYKLEPVDEDWRYIGTQNKVTFTEIDPGDYTLKIKASNFDKVWNEEGVSLKIVVAHPWWQTWWARLGFVLLGISGVFCLIQWRTKSLKSRQKKLEQTIKERTSQIVSEKKRSDELLLNILPFETAEELKKFGSAKTKKYEMVTVLFIDIKGFTNHAEQLTPEELIKEIDYCYKAYDRIIDKFNIEKIKTIGDAYMAAGGVPLKNDTNPIDTVKAALAIRDFMLDYKVQREKEGRIPFEIRIGIHTGSVIAGIVGMKKFAYDIWGDTVNLAARLEGKSIVGKVNISQSTYEKIQNNKTISFTPRGKIEAKNKGKLEMYFVDNKV